MDCPQYQTSQVLGRPFGKKIAGKSYAHYGIDYIESAKAVLSLEMGMESGCKYLLPKLGIVKDNTS